jgi:hypothetical protein
MTNKPKLGKVALVVFLTVLIWVWADLAQDDKISLTRQVTINVAPSANPATWIVFKKDESSKSGPAEANAAGQKGVVKKDEAGKPGPVMLDSMDLKGPAKKVADVRRMRDTAKLDLSLYIDPKREGLESEGSHVFDVLSFLRGNDQIKRLGLTVESCEPQKLTVEVQTLVERQVSVECFDANDNPLSTATIDPPQVKVLVPKDGVFTARIHLSADEQQRAKVVAVLKTPFVELAPSQPRNALQPATVKLPSEEVALNECTVQVTLGICFSTILQGKYQVKLENDAAFATVSVRATPAAEQEFKSQPFHVILYIDDEDARKSGTTIEREVGFLFPQAYVQRGEIKESRPLEKAKFTLSPVSSDVRTALPK